MVVGGVYEKWERDRPEKERFLVRAGRKVRKNRARPSGGCTRKSGVWVWLVGKRDWKIYK